MPSSSKPDSRATTMFFGLAIVPLVAFSLTFFFWAGSSSDPAAVSLKLRVLSAQKDALPSYFQPAGFQEISYTYSQGQHATCAEGIISVAVKTTNARFNLAPPKNNDNATQLLRSMFSPNSGFGNTLEASQWQVNDEYQIFGRLCTPKGSRSASESVQILTHGGTLDHTYWDLAPDYSYIDAAAQRGFTTFSYDRLGTGNSDHPDSIQVVQASAQAEVSHQLVALLKTGALGHPSFSQVIAVSHSAGSAITQLHSQVYPQDFDALVLTGISNYFSASSLGVISTAQYIANTDPSGRFDGIDNGYLTLAPVNQSAIFAFFYFPYFDKDLFNEQFEKRQTNALGETLTLSSAYQPVTGYTKPVAIINGERDFFFCGSSCTTPEDITGQTLKYYYPNAAQGSLAYSVPDSGHNINFHYNAQTAFTRTFDFIVSALSSS